MKALCFQLVLCMLLGYASAPSQQQPFAASQSQKQVSGMDREKHRAASPLKLKKEQEMTDHSSIADFTCPTDPFEPNDSLSVATPIAFMQTLRGAYICPFDDLDYYVFNANAGVHISAYVTASQVGSQLDPILGLYDSTGAELAFNDDYNGLDPLIEYIIPASGKYYLCVASYANKSAPNDFYSITLVSFHAISGTVFNDINHNGLKDSSETGLAGWTIELHSDTGVTTTVTDSNGYYSFGNLPTGWYTVYEQLQGGWAQVYPSSGDWSFYLVTDTVANYGNLQAPPSRVYGTLFNDLDDNGIRGPSEPGLAGWAVTIAGTINGFDTTVVTDSAGNYSAAGVPAGYCTVWLTDKSGWFTSLPGSARWSFLLAGLDTEADFGAWLPPPNKIWGVKFEDKNKNGVRDAGEGGLQGWTIELRRYSGTRVVFDTTTVTDDNGMYKFENLIYGDYGVFEQAESGWTTTYPPAGYWYYHYLLSDTVEADFGNWNSNGQTGDLRCTFSAAQLETAASSKQRPLKASSPLRPTVPNYANIVNTVIAGVKVGLSGQFQFSGASGELAYLLPSSYSDVWTTYWKGIGHTHTARGFDLDNTGKVMRKRWKSIPPTTKNDILIRDLLTFKINLLASADSLTHPGLGSLTYFDPPVEQHPLHGKTLDQIAAYADTIMTNWGGASYDTYIMLNTVVARINNAFATPSFSYNAAGWALGKLYVQGIRTVADVQFLRDGPIIAPFAAGVQLPQLPSKFELHQNYPNPFNPTTTISFDLPVASMVTVKVYDILGQGIATLIDHAEMDMGEREIEFDGSRLPSGVYFYRLNATGIVSSDGRFSGQAFTDIKKMMLVK